MALSLHQAAFKAYLWLEKLHKYGVTTSAPEALYYSCPEGFSKEELLEAIRNDAGTLLDTTPEIQELKLGEETDDTGLDLI